MTAHYQSQYAVGERILALGSPGRVMSITFTEMGTTLYEVVFDSGGADGMFTSDELASVKAA